MPVGSSPTARALQALELLQDRASISAAELAERLDVTERAVRRYVAILREADVPIDSERGPAGGYRLGRGARLAPVVFDETEALGLVMAVLEGHPAAADPGDAVGTALAKVIRALPGRVRRQAAELREHAAAAPDHHAAHPNPRVTGELIFAGASRRRVRVAYRSESGREWEAEVDPWAVVVRHGRWYLLCHCHRAEAVRTYRVDRIATVAVSDRSFVMPADLDPVASLEAHLGVGWEYPVQVSFDAPLEEVARWIHAPMGRLVPRDDGPGCTLVGTTSNPTMYAGEWLASVPLAFRIEAGDELRTAVADLARRCAAAVADQSA